MGRSSRVTVADVRSLLRLAGELHELPADREAQVAHTLRRLGELLHACVGSMQESEAFLPGVQGCPTVWGQAMGEESATKLFQRFAYEIQNNSPTVAYLARNPGRAVLRSEAMPNREWLRSEMFNEYVRPADIDAGLAGSYLLPRQGAVIGFSLSRSLRERTFGARERTLLQIFSDEFGWFFRSIASRHERLLLGDLPPYLRRVLSRLMAGDSEKQVALHLRLSRHTVHDYVKELHQRFSVSSRAELLIRVLEGTPVRTAWTAAGGESRDGDATITTPRRPAP